LQAAILRVNFAIFRIGSTHRQANAAEYTPRIQKNALLNQIPA